MFFTPVPWKLLDDVSIWTQNWGWIPQPAHGPVETKQSICTLCSNGCGLRVRMAAGYAVGVAGVSSNPVTQGALCPLGFAAHQLNWHPRRLREVRHRGVAESWERAQAAFEKACSEGPIAFVDGRPGRAASSVFEAFVQNRKGSYQTVLSEETEALAPYASWSGVHASNLGYDLENAKTIISFGAPLLDGWGTPGRFTRLWSQRAAGMSDPQLRLVQVETSLSRTAARAWRWVPIKEGSEVGLAAGLAQVLLEEQLVKAKGPQPQTSLAEAAMQTGLSVDAIRELARTMMEKSPVVVIGADGNPAIAALNVLLGAVGAPGGIVRNKEGAASRIQSVPAPASLRAILIDSTVPWEFAPKTGAEVFRFAAWDGGGNGNDWLLPAPGFLEELTDVPTAPASAAGTYAIAENLEARSAEVRSAAEFLAKIDPSLPVVENVIHKRCEEAFHERRGTVYAGQPIPVAKIESVKHLEEQLRKGAIWMDDPVRPGWFRCELKEWPPQSTASHDINWDAPWAPSVLPPLAAKLYQESNLREPPTRRNV